jgi:hypothetical protein
MGTVAKSTSLPLFEDKKGNDFGCYFYSFRSWAYKSG